MLTLSLLRHVKSSWNDPALADFDRPLNERGRAAASLMGTLLHREGLRPGHILCSPSARTRQTLDLARGAHNGLGAVAYPKGLYHATPVALLRAIHAAPAAERHVLLVGHNPGLHQLAIWLTGAGPADKRRALAEKLPTGGLVVMTFEVDSWRQVKPGGGHLRLFARPRDLTTHH